MTTVRQDQGAEIDGIAFAVFAKFGVGNAVTAATLVRTESLDAAQCIPKRSEMIGSLAVDPVKRETFRQLAASYRQMANDLAVIIAAQDESKNAA